MDALPGLPQTRECPDDFLEPFPASPDVWGIQTSEGSTAMEVKNAMKATIAILVLAAAFSRLPAQQSSDDSNEKNRLLFTTETFGGNGRTCQTCHSSSTGTVSPQDAQKRFGRNPNDPLFVFDGSDDGQGHGVNRMLTDATVLVQIPLPANVSMGDDPRARSVTLRRGTPSTLNTPALDQVLMLDGRDPDLPTQALHAVQGHYQATKTPTQADLLGISQFERTAPFFSSFRLLAYARGGPPPTLPKGTTASEKRGRLFFVDAPVAGDGRAGACALCHSGPMLNQTNSFFVTATFGLVPAGTRFQSVGVSEFNQAANPVHQFNWLNADGTTTVVWSPDPGRALITGRIDQPGPASDLNSFKIPILWGVKNTAPYFHDNSAKTLADVAAHYARLFLTLPQPIILTPQDQADIVAYLKLLN
jgi:cytochrome c peroxidase